MTVLLFACAVGAAVGCYRALRRLRADEQTGTVLYGFLQQLLLLSGALSVVALAFAVTEAFLAATPSDKVVATAFRAEHTLLTLRSWLEYLRVPWSATILVLVVV